MTSNSATAGFGTWVLRLAALFVVGGAIGGGVAFSLEPDAGPVEPKQLPSEFTQITK